MTGEAAWGLSEAGPRLSFRVSRAARDPKGVRPQVLAQANCIPQRPLTGCKHQVRGACKYARVLEFHP